MEGFLITVRGVFNRNQLNNDYSLKLGKTLCGKAGSLSYIPQQQTFAYASDKLYRQQSQGPGVTAGRKD